MRERDRELTKPAGSLGRLEELASWMAAWQGKKKPSCDRPLVCVFAANHGVAVHGVSAFPQGVTQQMLENFAAGGAAINQICAAFDFGFKVFDLALDLPTEDFTVRPALDEKSAVATMAFGMEAISGGTDLLILGEMGIGNTTSAAASTPRFMAAAAANGPGAAPASTMTRWPGRSSPSTRRSNCIARISRTRSKSCDALAGVRSPRCAARSSPRGCSASRSCSTAMW